jgi:hypothetical protein
MRLLRSVTVFITLLPLTERFFGLASTQLIGPGPRRPSIIMRPGMRALAPGEERCTVAGGGYRRPILRLDTLAVAANADRSHADHLSSIPLRLVQMQKLPGSS